MNRSRALLLTVCLLLAPATSPRSSAQSGGAWNFPIPDPFIRALDSITAHSLSGHVSFLASDVLDGRATPSKGQDIAAEYIASEFRRAGLETLGSGDYFQTSLMPESRPDCATFRCEITSGAKSSKVSREHFALSAVTTLDLERSPVFKLSYGRPSKGLPSLSGKVLMVEAPRQQAGEAEGPTASGEWRRFISLTRNLSPALVVWVDPENREPLTYFDTPSLRTTGNSRRLPLIATITEPSVAQILDELPNGDTGATFSLSLKEAPSGQHRLHNVAGVLRGADPVLGDTYVLLTAHYDGTGPTASGAQDRIWNAANDNASGVAALLDIALALGSMKERPRRSVVFLAFFGEENGMLGSRYYAGNPLVPIRSTIAAINLEQLGRTDAPEGDQTGRANVTGYDYSQIGEVFKEAADQSGIALSGGGRDSDTYFMASDNIVLAEMGVPSHTLCVSYVYPDYHGPGDHWDKMDFDNMVKVTRMAARALLLLALSDHEPHWNMSNPRAARFSDARARRGDSH